MISHIAIYAMDFNIESYPPRSLWEGSISPMVIPPEMRMSSPAASIVKLAPDFIDENDAFNAILEDIHHRATEGFLVTYPNNSSVRIFIYTVGFYGDYLAACAMSDAMGHTADVLCNL